VFGSSDLELEREVARRCVAIVLVDTDRKRHFFGKLY